MDTTNHEAKLQEELMLLEDELKELGINNPQVKEDWIETSRYIDTLSADPNVVADRTEEYNTRRAELSLLEGRWNDVNLALKKIKEGTYGICEVSGEPIEKDRLAANPAARTCKAHMNDQV